MRELLLINLDGLVYGMWEDEVFSVDELTTIHRLPVSPAFIAGVSIIHDRAVTLADLSVCVGHAPMKRSGAGHVLIMSDTEKFAGFVIESDISKTAILPDFIYPLPDYIKTPVIDSCVIVDSLPVPVINISTLYIRVQKTAPEPLAAQLTLSGSHGDITSIETIRMFEIHGERFAASAVGIEEQVMKSGHSTRLKQAPRFVRGIAFLHERILPVIDLLQRLNMQETENRGFLLVVELGGLQFGLLIHADEGTLKKEDVAIKYLPPIAQSRWLRSSVMYAGEIVPLLDLGALMFSEQESEQEKPVAQRYATDSGFLDLFGREETDVVEFSLLGQRHALPKSEVNDIIGFKPYREIPNVPNIVIGVAEYKEELLPVLDLAMVFGRRSLATSDWRMLHVINGDFQALVITEVVFGEQRLPLDIQKAVPIALPHHVVYGCYPDADSVRLILNVEALAVYFEKALVQELLPTMTPEMKQARAEIVPSLVGEPVTLSSYRKTAEALQEQHIADEQAAALQSTETGVITPDEEYPEAHAVSEILSTHVVTEEVQKPEGIAESAKELREPVPAPSIEEIVPEGHKEEEPAPMAFAETQIISEPAPVPEQEQVSETALGQREKPAEELHEETALPRYGDAIQEKIIESAVQEEATALPQTEFAAKKEYPAELTIPEPYTRLERDITEQPLQEKTMTTREGTSVVEPIAPAIPEKAEPVSQQPAPEIEPRQVYDEKETISATPVGVAQAGGEFTPQTEQISFRPERQTPDREQKEEEPITPPREYEKAPSSDRRWQRRMVYGAIGAVIVLILYLSGVFEQTLTDKKLTTTPAAKSAVESAKTAQKPTESKPARIKPAEPLVLTVPSDVGLEIDNYIVKKDDTLWDISKRYTGDPLNYPRIAGENRIADPDLIFPGQKIFLQQEMLRRR